MSGSERGRLQTRGADAAAMVRAAIGPSTEAPIARPTVLVIQARTNPIRIEQERQMALALANRAGVSLRIVNPLTEIDHPWDNPQAMMSGVDGVWFLGSSDIDLTVDNHAARTYRETVYPLARAAYKAGTERRTHNRIPVFGSCLGHQAIHEANGGVVQRDLNRQETGTPTLRTFVDHPIFDGVPRQKGGGILVIAAHKDTVTVPAPGSRVVGATEKDPLAMTIRRDVITASGHPEMVSAADLQLAVDLSIAKHAADPEMEIYFTNYPILDTPGTDRIIINYFNLVRERAAQRSGRKPHYA